MASLQQNMTEIRYLLDEPAEGTPSQRILWSILQNQIFHHKAQLQNSSAQWDVNSWPLITQPGVEDYLVTATDFGKPFWTHTEDLSQPQLARVEIPFAMVQNTDMFYQGPVQPYLSSSDLFSASVISFYSTAGSWYARITPVPGGNVTYRVWYEVTPGAPLSIGDSPGISPFHHLIRVKTELAALAYCGWGDVRSDAEDPRKAQAWDRKTKALGAALGLQMADFERQFETYLGTLAQAGVERRSAFGDDYLQSTDIRNLGYLSPNQFSR